MVISLQECRLIMTHEMQSQLAPKISINEICISCLSPTKRKAFEAC